MVGKGRDRGALGVGVKIWLPPTKRGAGTKIVIKIPYTIRDGCSAVQFLSPSQTAGKAHPYLFTQCQAIHARALLPCQDSYAPL